MTLIVKLIEKTLHGFSFGLGMGISIIVIKQIEPRGCESLHHER